MEKLKSKIGSGALGAASGLAGIAALSQCSGGCTSCFGCLGAGLGVALVVLCQRIRESRSGTGRTASDQRQ